jgi:hypothetical protein
MNASGVAEPDADATSRPSSRILNQTGEIFGRKHQSVVHRAELIVHLSLWNGAAPAMTNE